MPTNDHSSHRWIWITSVFWLGLGLFDAMQTVLVMRSEGMHHAWPTLFVVTVVSWLPWAVATPVIVRLGRRFPPVKLRPYQTWLVHLGGCVGIGLIFAAWTAWLEVVFNPYADPSAPTAMGAIWLDRFASGILSTLVLYAGILIVSYVFDSKERLAFAQTETARLNESLSKAQLDALRQQIEPHFLFNTLNAVAGLIRDGRSEAAVTMIASLSDFLRRILADSARHEVPLGEELAFTKNYLDIQKVRFADRLRLHIDVPSDLHAVWVPNLILQPLVENAIQHGIAKRAAGGAIAIVASGGNGVLILRVRNDGPQLPADWATTRTGIGLSNVRSRLASLYGDAFELRLSDLPATGVEVSVSLPLRESADVA